MKSKRIAAFCMCAVMAFSAVLAGCNGSDDQSATADEATHSATVDEASSAAATTAPAATDAKKDEKKDTNKKTDKEKKEEKKDESEKQPSYEPPVSADPTTCTVTVGNKDHKVSVGSTVTYTCYLKTPDKIEDVQAKVNYTAASLMLVDKTVTNLFPVMGKSTVCNADNPGVVLFNAVDLEGFDFTSKSSLVTLKFEVLAASSAAISTKVEFVTGVGGDPYIDYGKVVSGVNASVEETLK